MTNTGERPVRMPAAPRPNQSTNSTLFKPSASTTSVANHASTFHAAVLPITSSQDTTPQINISEMPASVTIVGSITRPPNTHRPSASTTSAAMVASRRLTRPSFASSWDAQRGTSALVRTSGGYSLYTTQG